LSTTKKPHPACDSINTENLKLGMYITELDRPWLGTPFLLQGFLLEKTEEIEQLRQYCKTVLSDRSRSVGEQHRARPRERQAPRRGTNETGIRFSITSETETADSDFLPMVRSLRKQGAFPTTPRARPAAHESSLEAEMLYSAPIVDDVHRTLEAIRQGTDPDGNLDLTRVCGLVEEMAAGVERNPDAMLWLTRLKITDQYSYDHAVDVSVHLMVFGRFLGLGSVAIEILGQAGLMQDIGKAQIDPDILGKPSALSDAEYLEVQSHVASSLELLVGQHAFATEVLSIIGAHHERHDGSGYPRRLNGEKLGLHAELAGLIDTYCAITRHRVFSEAVSSQKALEMLSRMRGTTFRAALVDQFVQCVGLYPIGTLVELNSGEVAVVIQQNQVRRLKPRLLILLAPDKTLERRPRSLDLILEPTTPTGEPYRIRQALPTNAYGIDPVEFFLN
jgi:HD-GYP domain-containing protein (c-di-GMP phosphodiesterase class II)